MLSLSRHPASMRPERQEHTVRLFVRALRGMGDGSEKISNDVIQVKSCEVSIGSPFNWCRTFSAGLVHPKQGGPSSAGGSPDLVAVEGVCSSRECKPIALAVGELDPKHASALWVRMRFQQKPPKHRASCGLALRTSSSFRSEPPRLQHPPRKGLHQRNMPINSMVEVGRAR